ncbi:MAG TPA: carbohydrate kinase [Candidatus Flavonifractor merdigallinarum]|uniref:Carbohydrate kinase n=1 Tax=Candidatus Flavonifractor merdigallinarum TaxID=2838589 RepID=A0A9D1YB71_9FIRM|nr:carbohydrate kinase [Candidatus Flavonifractor merdigallinarum]
MPEIVTMGEALIDLTQTAEDSGHIRHYAAFPGGAPANVAVAAARLGAKAAFIGKVGRDAFGASIRETLTRNQVDVSGLYESGKDLTTLAVVSVDAAGERSFAFYRTPGADTQLTREEAVQAIEAYEERPIFLHFGSVSLTAEPARSATLEAARRARELGILLSYDPNYRANLWPDQETAVARMKEPLSLCHVLKVAEEELELLTGIRDLEAGTRSLYEKYGTPLIVATLGEGGSFYRLGTSTGQVPAQTVQVADTNGAGDTFLGGLLSRLVRCGGLEGLTPEKLERELDFANRAAALTCTRPGAIPAMPVLDEVTGGKEEAAP